ncbi:MAG: LAGLIDADG family homing endonuclease [Candidatus Diapherotrites archaeon]
MALELSNKASLVGRSLKDIEAYGEKGTAYIGKVVMSSGEKPVLGRKILCDIAKPHVMLICGKRGGGKCLHGDTLITLSDGSLVKIKDLENDNRKVISLNQKYKINESEKKGFFKRPVDRLLEIELRSGKKIKLTPEHPLLTIEGWKPAEELKKGGRVATPRKIEYFGNEFLRECEIKLLAYLIAEGHTKRRVVWFTNTDEKIVADFKASVKEFDKNLKVNLSAKSNLRVVSANPKIKIVKAVRKNGKFAKGTIFEPQNTMRAWLKDLGVYDLLSHDKYVPASVMNLPKNKLSLFLNRLFSCDGSIYFESNRFRLSYSSVSEKLIRQVQHLLLRFGILSKLRKKVTNLEGKKFDSFELVVDGENVKKYLQEIGFYGEKETKQENALMEIRAIKRNPNLDTIPKEIWGQYTPKNWAEVGRVAGYKIPKSMRESKRYCPSREKLLQIAKADKNEVIELLAKSDIYWDEIKDIKELTGSFEVYDISVPRDHNFVANDIIVHNSYTLSVLLEEFARQPMEIRKRISVIAIDTVGIFWTLKIANKLETKELQKWDLKPEKTNVRVLVPKGKLNFYRDKKLPVDDAFTIKTSELDVTEWLALFKLTWKDGEGILLTRIIEDLKEQLGTLYGIDEIITAIMKDSDSEDNSRKALVNRFRVAKSWGLFEKEGTRIKEIAKAGEITVIDVSAYRQAIGMQGTRDIIVGLLGKKLFEERMLYRKEEEVKLTEGLKRESEMPIVWMLIDEAHMFMPKDEDNIALHVLLEWVRVGRQPGLSLVLATQRPNKLHPDAISQCDLFISHRMTSQPDIDAVSQLRPSYLHQNFDKYYQEMPKSKGYALILDDNTEKLWMVKIRPRFSWDGGVTASAFTD